MNNMSDDDDNSCVSDTSSSVELDEDNEDAETSTHGQSSAETIKEVRDVTQFVGVVRLMVVLIVLTFAFVSAESVYLTTTNHETSNFQDAYAEVSQQLIEATNSRIRTMLLVAKMLATNIGTEYKRSDWPFVSISDFHERCEVPIELTNASMISFLPKVLPNQLMFWQDYATSNYLQENPRLSDDYDTSEVQYYASNREIKDGIYQFQNQTSQSIVPDDFVAIFPVLQMSPMPNNSHDLDIISNVTGILFTENSNIVRSNALQQVINRIGSVMTQFLYQDTNFTDLAYYDVPRTNIYYPITTNISEIVGVINLQFQWEVLFQQVIGEEYNEQIVVVVENSCGGTFSYEVEGPYSSFLGQGDLHNTKVTDYGPYAYNTSYNQFIALMDPFGEQPMNSTTGCSYRVIVYPSSAFKDMFFSSRPNMYRGIVIFALATVLLVFFASDTLIERKHQHIANAAARSDAIVRSLFPGSVADRLYQKHTDNNKNQSKKAWRAKGKGAYVSTQKSRISSALQNPLEDQDPFLENEPLADLYPSASVIFADMAGFTSWSTARDPSQVFLLLENIYRSMDSVAKRMQVFKVETIGDCYVAATGIPDARDDHAVVLCRYARACLIRTSALFKSLVTQLGPGTEELLLRVGIHSGPVTAGVLRGSKSRFQLFGDTINTASRMESTGMKGRIQISSVTAKLLIAAGKSSWMTMREDKVEAKGLGLVETYWLHLGRSLSSKGTSVKSDSESNSNQPFLDLGVRLQGNVQLESAVGQTQINSGHIRLIEWNCDVMLDRLKAIVKRRDAIGFIPHKPMTEENERSILCPTSTIPSKEVKMSISVPDFDPIIEEKIAMSRKINISQEVQVELRKFITAVASAYPNNAFHSFVHASNVVLAATKLLKRIMAADEHGSSSNGNLTSHDLYVHTFGISSDPLAQFAIIFSCLVHDIDHPGVPNVKLMEESPYRASKYESRSVAEQHSVDIAFDLLMLPEFSKLRRSIYHTEKECKHFRQLCVNMILATDLMDRELNAMRNERWDLCFKNAVGDNDLSRSRHNLDTSIEQAIYDQQKQKDDLARKATIVMELIIQVSDVSHTFGHWAIYTKWNECLFHEMYFAYLDGRADKDPSEQWYQGELNFYDYYLIPLAQKLKDCWRVFGISQSEFFNYASSNRMEWSFKGHDVVSNMKQRAIEKSNHRIQSSSFLINTTTTVSFMGVNDALTTKDLSATTDCTNDDDDYDDGDNNNNDDGNNDCITHNGKSSTTKDCLTTSSAHSAHSAHLHHSFEPVYTKQTYFDRCEM